MSWNRSTTRPKTNPATRRNRRLLGIAVFFLAVAAAGFGIWLLFRDGERKSDIGPSRAARGAIKEAVPHISQSAAGTSAPKPAEPAEMAPSEVRVKTLSFITNNFGSIVERYQTADGKTHREIRPSRPPVFRHATDSIISMALAQPSMGAMPPLPLRGDMDRQFLRSLEEPIVIEETDSDEVKERKRIVREARVEIKKMMDRGMHFAEIMADHEKTFNENADIRRKAIAEATKIRDEGDSEGTAQYVEAMNAAFETMGIEKIDMPRTKEERSAELEAKRAARAAARAEKEKTK